MTSRRSTYIVNNIALPVHASFEEAFSVAKRKLRVIGINPKLDELAVFRRSIDARKKSDIKFVYSIAWSGYAKNCSPDLLSRHGISSFEYTEPEVSFGSVAQEKPIAVVGSGPAGMFCALTLVEAGFSVLLIEKGGSISERKRSVENFKNNRTLDTSSNIQFGAGGAGTFSDGKLVTRIGDAMSTYVIERFVEFGAPAEIRYIAKPHIGTDILTDIVDNILLKITYCGSRVLYHTELLDFKEVNGRVSEIITNNGTFPCSALVLATGHSARDTYYKLFEHQMMVEAKPFSVGMRIEHPKTVIDRGLYGDMAGDPVLPAGEYNLSYDTRNRGVYTFCMCPGGEVVAATSEEGGVVVNGMSYHSRNGENSNSAVCCSIFREDYGASPASAIEFQRRIERLAYKAGGGDYSAPIITVGDFLTDKCSTEPSEVIPTYMDGSCVRLASPGTYLPDFVVSKIKLAINDFDKKIHGFAMPGAVLTGAETRTSAPVRVVRDNDTRLAIGYKNLYPCGEGAGYAGGITSSAIDGIRSALALMKCFRPKG